jgi:hypothetical protein
VPTIIRAAAATGAAIHKETPMIRKVLGLVSVGVLLWRWNSARRDRAAIRRLQGSQRPREPLQVWEGEGGALPDSGAQLRPAPSQPA